MDAQKTSSKRKAYPSDLSDLEFERIEALLPPPKRRGRKRSLDLREVVNAILYVLKTGVQWEYLPHDFPAKSSVYDYYSAWKEDGTWKQIAAVLLEEARVLEGRERTPSMAIVDAQSVQNTGALDEERGFDGGKKVRGRKRHFLVDTVGLILGVLVTLSGCSTDVDSDYNADAMTYRTTDAKTNINIDTNHQAIFDSDNGSHVKKEDMSTEYIDINDTSNAFDMPKDKVACWEEVWRHRTILVDALTMNDSAEYDDGLSLHNEPNPGHQSFEGEVDRIEEIGTQEAPFMWVYLKTLRPDVDPPFIRISFGYGVLPRPTLEKGDRIRFDHAVEALPCTVDPLSAQQNQWVRTLRRMDGGAIVYMDGRLGVFDDNSIGTLPPIDDEAWRGLQWEDDSCPVERFDPENLFAGGATVRLVFDAPYDMTASLGATASTLPGYPNSLHIHGSIRPNFNAEPGRCGSVMIAMTNDPDAP